MWFEAARYEGARLKISVTGEVLALSDCYDDGAPSRSSCWSLPSQPAQWPHSYASSDRIDSSPTMTGFLACRCTQGLNDTGASQRLKGRVSGGVRVRLIPVRGNPG